MHSPGYFLFSWSLSIDERKDCCSLYEAWNKNEERCLKELYQSNVTTMCGFKKSLFVQQKIYFELVYLVTAFVPSLTACFASSPGRRSLTDV